MVPFYRGLTCTERDASHSHPAAVIGAAGGSDGSGESGVTPTVRSRPDLGGEYEMTRHCFCTPAVAVKLRLLVQQ